MRERQSKFDISVSESTIQKAVAGDETSFEVIYHAFRLPVLGLGRRICRNDAAALDVVQDVFLQVFQMIHRFRGDGPFWAWLRMIAVRKALDHAEKSNRFVDAVPDNSHDLQSMAPEDAVAIQQVLAELPEKTRLILWLNRIEGFTHRELSDLTGMTESYSKSLVSRALQELAKRHSETTANTKRGAA